ncbi:MAG TPA: 6,7-dimethyl-8-ribityllumazine synthase [Parasegetibacter sp.]|jgi:6,7-dimethyl-8-ribityllumazine synthase
MATNSDNTLYEINTGIPPTDACVVMVRTEWNASIVDKLEEGCRKVFNDYGIAEIKTLSVPGAFEIPFAIKSYWEAYQNSENLRPDAFIALGCVIRGDTPHFDYVCKAVTDGVVNLNLQLPVPTIFGVLTVDNPQQAEERTGGVHGQKGEEAAITALKMIALQRSFKNGK